jgi:Single-strand binding protein family
MTEASVSFAGNLTDQPEVRCTDSGIARARFRVAVSGRREQEPSFFTVWRDQAEHVAESLAKGSRVVVMGPTPAAGMDRRGWQRPIRGRGRGRGAGAESALGHRDTGQGAQEPRGVDSSISAAVFWSIHRTFRSKMAAPLVRPARAC